MAGRSEIKTAIECVADFPDDQLEKDGEIVRPGGMGVAEAIAQLLSQAGLSVSEPSLDFEHGWEFFAEVDGRRFWVLVTDLDQTKLIQTRDVSPFARRLFRGQAAYANFLKEMYRMLSDDARFSSVQWID